MADKSIPQLEDSRTITLKRTQYSITPNLTWRQRLAAKLTQTIALATIAVAVATIVISAATPALLPIPA